MKQSIKTHWLSNIFGNGYVECRWDEEGVTISSGDNEQALSWDDISEPPTLEQGWFFNTCIINHYTIRWLPPKASRKFQRQVQKAWYHHHAQPLTNFENTVLQHVRHNFLRTSHYQSLQQQAKTLKEKYKRLPPERLLPPQEEGAYLFVERLVTKGDSFLERARKSFIRKEQQAHQTFFDTVEKDELTEKQREACITDNDNNLVLAGAGTGKTSTMVGKAGYLVASGRAKPDEILMLAFGNKAAKELQDRIDERLVNPAIQASTFHSLGLSIIAAVEQSKPGVTDLAFDKEKKDKYINDCLEQLLQQPHFKKKAVRYFEQYLHPDANPFEFTSLGDYWKFLESNDIRSLKGDKVKSHGELLIANFLFTHGIEYQYEAKYQYPTRTAEFKQYQPDFYLTQYGIYLEHYGTDREGNTAPYIDKDKYNASIQWKRQTHQDYNTICLETFHYEKQEGILLESLAAQLTEQGIPINPVSEDALLDNIKALGEISVLSRLLADLLSNIKNRCSSQQEAIAIAQQAKDSRRAMAALELLIPIWDEYERELQGNKGDTNNQAEIDFNDMLHQATRYVVSGQYKPHWKYILIDEFQDISSARAKLVKALKDHVKGCSLFCVGDDWQSIYRFTGSDLNYTANFEKAFGDYSLVTLDKTYRFNNSICDVATQFVMQNPIQFSKELHTHTHVDSPAVSVLRASGSYDPQHLDTVLTSLSQRVTQESSVYLLSRYNFLIKENTISTLNSKFPLLKITQLSMHGSKGKQADYVVVVGLESGKYGFPSEKVTHPLIDLYLPPEERYPHAEERRLMYVAITRAKHRVYLIADMEKPSVFMSEDLLGSGEYDLCLDEFETPPEQMVLEGRGCPKCKTGQLVKRQNTEQGTYFMGCTNYSRCDYTESCCPQCNSLMNRKSRFRVCINCGWKIATCPVCPGEMKKTRTNHWGCTNYRGPDEYPSCGHQESYIDFK